MPYKRYVNPYASHNSDVITYASQHYNANPYASHCIETNLYTSHPNVPTQAQPGASGATPPVWIPTLDLACLSGDEDKEGEDQGQGHTQATLPQSGKEGGGALFVKKAKPSFVFPCDTALASLDMRKARHQVMREDDSHISSVGSYRNCKTTVEPLPGGNKRVPGNDKHRDDNTISFTLGDGNLERYLSFDYDHLDILSAPENVDTATAGEVPITPLAPSEAAVRPPGTRDKRTKGDKPDSKGDGLPEVIEEVIEVVVVNGHLKPDNDHSLLEVPEEEAGTHAELDTAGQDEESATVKDKARPRVTFSFDQNLTPHGSVKRYSPIKGDVNFRPQGVLKKPPPPPQLQGQSHSRPFDFARTAGHHLHKDGGLRPTPSYHLDPHADLRLGPQDQAGIPVKHVHTTNADLEKKRQGGAGSAPVPATNNAVVQRPPAPNSTRITLSMAAEKAASATGGATGRRTLSRSHNYTSAHTRGRMAYFRPADGCRSSSNPSVRSKSTEDVSYQESKARLQTDGQGVKSSRSRANLPFTLRRCASSEHELLINPKQKPTKPKIAFGSFILPKEPVCTLRTNHLHFSETEAKAATQGTYVHAHTRRSPYAAPAQLYLKDGQQKGEMARRPVTSHTRPLPQQQATPTHPCSKEQVQRHSAPSSYGPTRDKPVHSHQGPSSRLSISTPPTRNPNPKPHVSTKTSHAITPGGVRDSYLVRTNLHSSTTQAARVRKSADFDPSGRPNMAAMAMLSRRDKGASHHRFVAKLRDFANRHDGNYS